MAVPGHLDPERRDRLAVESRLGATIAVVVAAALTASLPERVITQPRWLLPAITVVLAVVVFSTGSSRDEVPTDPVALTRHRRVRVLAIVMTVVLSLANFVTGTRLIVDILRHQGIHDAPRLLWAGGSVWITNVIVFGLWYWELDRGGRIGRALGQDGHDFLFPQWGLPSHFGFDGWEPEFVDYFYFSFTNAAAFSPTDVMPLSQWAKVAMMLQSALSIGIIVVVVADAVNIL
ncbi:MAG: hypothetical protein WCI50_07395 [Actinomycetes bacterium]